MVYNYFNAMKRKHLLIGLVLAALLLMSGCASPGQTDTTTTDTQITTTETPDTTTPGDTTTAENPGTTTTTVEIDNPIVPGVGEDGTVSASKLIEAHQQEVSGASFTYTQETDRNFNGESNSNILSIKYNSGEEMYLIEYDDGKRVTYSDSSLEEDYVRFERQDNTVYISQEKKLEVVSGTASNFVHEGLINLFEYEVKSESDDKIVLASTSVVDTDTLKATTRLSDVENSNMELHVSKSGTITQAILSAESSSGNSTSYKMTLSEVGSTTLEKPDWVGTAAENAVKFDASTSSDKGYITLGYTQGTEIPAGTTVRVMVGRDSFTTTLDEPLSPGTTYYVKPVFGESGLEITTSEPTTDETFGESMVNIGIYGEDSIQYYTNSFVLEG